MGPASTAEADRRSGVVVHAIESRHDRSASARAFAWKALQSCEVVEKPCAINPMGAVSDTLKDVAAQTREIPVSARLIACKTLRSWRATASRVALGT